MCGIVGYWSSTRGDSAEGMRRTVGRMADVLRARGPDDNGMWVDPHAGIALGHRRLAVIDVSPAGSQPMTSADGRMVLIYNGELYNTAELRQELVRAGSSFRGHSDTEVIVEACAAWGVSAAVQRLSGMFSFALWDIASQELFLARDKIGIKPLYWGRQGDVFFFGSQMKAFAPHPCWRPELDRDAIASYVRFGYVPSPYAIYKNMAKLSPGHILRIDRTNAVRISRYWDVDQIATRGASGHSALSDEAATDALERVLRDAVKRHMVSDVPTGAFLSGGIDSSLVAAMMQAEGSDPIKTFSIGFTEDAYDEARYAKAVAHHIGSDHTEFYATPQDAIAVIPDFPDWYDEPFADSSQIPTFLVSRLARQDVVVALSGDGGDELFAGYNRYMWGERLRHGLMWIPALARRGLSGAMCSMPPSSWDKFFSVVPRSLRPPQSGSKMHKIAHLLTTPDREALYRNLVSQWREPSDIVRGGTELPTAMDDNSLSQKIPDYIAWMQLMDMRGYLPDDILTKVDRASMAISLEARVPLLDSEVVEFAMSLPLNMKIRAGKSKWLLRQVLHRYVPRPLVDRPKMGFGVPIGDWLRGELRDWAEDLLDGKRIEDDGIFDPAPIRQMWNEHLTQRQNWQYPLWVVLMFQAWRNSPLGAGAVAAPAR